MKRLESVVAQHRFVIADHVLIGDLVAVYDSNYHPVDEVDQVRVAPVHLCRNAWIGRAAVVLPGVTVGHIPSWRRDP